MAKKSQGGVLLPCARRMYSEGLHIAEISRRLQVSEQSLFKWKYQSKKPGKDVDEWDRARIQRFENIQRLRDLFEREMNAAEAKAAGTITSSQVDALAKLSSMVQRWETIEKDANLKHAVEAREMDKPALFLEILEWIAKKLKQSDPQGLAILAKNFDLLAMDFKLEYTKK